MNTGRKALAEPPTSRRPQIVDHEEPTPGHEVKVRPRKPGKAQPGPAAKANWPDAGSAEVEVPSRAFVQVR